MSLIKSIGGKNVNFDFNKEFLSIFSDKIKTSDIKFINQTLEDLHPSDVANLIENLSSETRAKLLEIEEFDIEPEIFVEINESIQTKDIYDIEDEGPTKSTKFIRFISEAQKQVKRFEGSTRTKLIFVGGLMGDNFLNKGPSAMPVLVSHLSIRLIVVVEI